MPPAIDACPFLPLNFSKQQIQQNDKQQMHKVQDLITPADRDYHKALKKLFNTQLAPLYYTQEQLQQQQMGMKLPQQQLQCNVKVDFIYDARCYMEQEDQDHGSCSIYGIKWGNILSFFQEWFGASLRTSTSAYTNN
mgnify:CR=1 FL=1